MTMATLARAVHGVITMERAYAAAPARVFSAWSDVRARERWGRPTDETVIVHDKAEFRVGGHAHGRFRPEGAPFMLSNDTWYLEIVQARRIALAYTMAMDGKPMSHSVAVTEFIPDGAAGCRLVFTEQGAYHGGEDDVRNRRLGSEGLFDKLALELDTHA